MTEYNDILYIVVPCYNEEEVLHETSKRLKEKMTTLINDRKISDKSRVLFVDDGSKDRTWEIIEELHEGDDLFSGLKLSRNKGHQNALLAGLMTAKDLADISISMDADLQDDINVVDKFVDKYHEGCDIVYGVRSSRKKDTVFKRGTAGMFYKLMRLLGVDIIDNHADYRAVNVNEYKPGFFEFDLKEWNTTDTTRIRLSVPGRHNIYNALAMCAVCRFVGLSAEQCAEAALNFKGAGRRFEVYGECNGALVIDDYAHHPTELRATLNTAKEMGYKRLIAVHQPFTYSRTKMLFNDFVDVLKIPDITVLTPIMGSREPNDPTITSAKLAAQIPGSVLVDSLQAAADWVKQNAQPGDLVITLGCGDIYKASKMMVADNQ